MALKVAISGKGGVGKTTLAGTLARLHAAAGHRVLAVDADPDANLASALGMPAALRDQARTLRDERLLIEARTGAKVREFGQMFSLNPDVTGIAEEYAVRHAGVDLLVLGAAQEAGAGCACPENVLLKALVRHLLLRGEEAVILDMEAGIEHLGRGTAAGVDLVLAVVEPGRRSVETALRVRQMAAAIGIDRFAVVANKLTDPAGDEAWLRQQLDGAPLLTCLPHDPRIVSADRQGLALVDLGDDGLIAPYQRVHSILMERHARPAADAETKE